jgi:hypothetical protein
MRRWGEDVESSLVIGLLIATAHHFFVKQQSTVDQPRGCADNEGIALCLIWTELGDLLRRAEQSKSEMRGKE